MGATALSTPSFCVTVQACIKTSVDIIFLPYSNFVTVNQVILSSELSLNPEKICLRMEKESPDTNQDPSKQHASAPCCVDVQETGGAGVQREEEAGGGADG